MQAGRISLTIGLASMVLSVILGAVLGAIAGFYRGIVDNIIMRLADILMSMPGLPLLIIMGAILSEWKVPSRLSSICHYDYFKFSRLAGACTPCKRSNFIT